RPAEIWKPASDRKPARIVRRKAKLPATDLHGRRKTGIEIDEGEIAHADAGHRERLLAHRADRGRGVIVHALADVPDVVGIAAAMQEHPFRLRDVECARL